MKFASKILLAWIALGPACRGTPPAPAPSGASRCTPHFDSRKADALVRGLTRADTAVVGTIKAVRYKHEDDWELVPDPTRERFVEAVVLEPERTIFGVFEADVPTTMVVQVVGELPPMDACPCCRFRGPTCDPGTRALFMLRNRRLVWQALPWTCPPQAQVDGSVIRGVQAIVAGFGSRHSVGSPTWAGRVQEDMIERWLAAPEARPIALALLLRMTQRGGETINPLCCVGGPAIARMSIKALESCDTQSTCSQACELVGNLHLRPAAYDQLCPPARPSTP